MSDSYFDRCIASNVLPTLALLFAGPLLLGGQVMAEAIPVELKKTEQGWRLLRDGEPYFIRGAGGTHSLELLAAAGANSVRTWGGDDIGSLLDEAHSLGLSVTVGIWLGHERHGFDYKDKTQVAEQLQRARDMVLKFKDHPAVLLWGIGNEMEGFEDGDDPVIWAAVNDVAAMAKELDPHHPTMTVTAAQVVPERLRAGGATKPFVLTEFGPPGSWEVATTEWGAPFEMTSSEKAEFYRNTYERTIEGEPGLALGSYAFTWGFKMEATATWFGLFLDDGSRLAAVDALAELWSGAPPANRAPAVEPLVIDGEAAVDPGAELRVRTATADADGDAISTRWALRPESGEYATGGDFRPLLSDIEGAVLEGRTDGATVRMPEEPGAYRLFYYAYDGSGNAATANIPLLVKGEVRTRFPVSVYEDQFEGMPWAPSGWMGLIDSLTLDGQYAEIPHDGHASIRIRYEGTFGWAGIAWQNPANNWGDQEGGYDLSGATRLELWARGEYGGEKVSFGVGLIGSDKPYADSGTTKVEGIELTRDWQRFVVPLKNIDLSSIKTGFVVILTGRQSPVTIYLDSIRFVR